jgi:hypothetical protein
LRFLREAHRIQDESSFKNSVASTKFKMTDSMF